MSTNVIKWNNASVTAAGFNLQAQLLEGGGFEFTRVTGADAAGENKITLSMQPAAVDEGKITVPVLLNNTSLDAGFTMTQLRFYAKGTGGAPSSEILYAVAQDPTGDYIPSAAESPGFSIDWSYTFQFGNADNVTVELDPAGLVSFDSVGKPNGVAPLGPDGMIPEQYIDASAGAALAPEYNPGSTYEKDDFCIYEGDLYQANVDIDPPEAWTAAHWNSVSVASAFVPNTQKGVASGVATLDSSGKLADTQKPTYTAADVGAVPTTRTVNEKALSSDIALSAADVGAIANPSGGTTGQVLTKTTDGAEWGDTPAAGGSLLTISFDGAFGGLPYTLTGGEESYSGTVPASLEAVHSLLAIETQYILTVTNSTEEESYTRTIQTLDYFTALEVSIAPFAATITVTCPAGSTVTCVNGSTNLQQTATSGTAIFTVGNTGTWTITATLGDETASGEVVISADGEQKSITLSYFSATITVNTDAGASVTCVKGDDTQTKTATGGTAVFTVTEAGTYTVTSTSGDNVKSDTVVISADGDAKTVALYFSLSDYSPAEIAAISEAGKAAQYFQTGDTIDIQLSGIGTMTLEIADFDHDYLSGSTSASKAGISFITKNLLYTEYQMNTSNTNVGGFPDSKLYDTLSSTIWNAIPAEWRNVIKTVYKWYGTGNDTNNGEWFGSKIWVPLEYEMFGTTTHSPATEHSTGNARKYPIFTNNNSRIKKMNNGAGSANYYWEASPGAGSTAGFCAVGGDGSANDAGATTTAGVCFGLSV